MIFSNYQTAIFAAVENERFNILVDAKAGSGKTFTLVECCNYLSPFDEICALAFNKVIATQLQSRVPSHVNARTFNSLGYGCVMQRFPGIKMESRKSSNILKQIVPNNYHEDYLYDLVRLLDHGKSWGLGLFAENSEATWAEFVSNADEFDISGLGNRAYTWLYKAYKRSIEDTTIMDFNDQILFPLLYQIRGKQFDVILVDEAQDLSPLQHTFIKNFLAPSGRMIGFGDPHQAIYGFRGADKESMENLGKRFDVHTYPLSISYRCPRAVVDEAKQIVPGIEAAEDAKDGLVQYLTGFEISIFKPTDLILCRNNAPLISLALRFLQENKPVHVRGEFGKQIIAFIKRFKTDSLPLLVDRLDAWYKEEQAEAEKTGKGHRMSFVVEKYDAILAVILKAKDVTTVAELIKVFARLFESGRGTTLSSIHRAKGEEAERVFLYRPDLIPSKYAKTRGQRQQEDNLLYVAITRSLNEFYYLND